MRTVSALLLTLSVLIVSSGTASAADSQPDAHIRIKGGTWRGDDVYSTDASGQVVTKRSARGKSVSFEVIAENDGTITEEIVAIDSCTPGTRFEDSNGHDVTGTVQSGYWKGTLDPGESLSSLFVILKVPKNYPQRPVSCKLTFKSASDVKDAVRAVVKVK